MPSMRRREFVALLGGAAAWPLAVHAQQTAMPVIGFLDPTAPEALAEPMRGLRQGLKDVGYVEGENLTIEYRWADNRTERVPAMAAELVGRRVSLIVATGGSRAPLAGQGGNHDDTDRLQHRRQPGDHGSCRQLGPTGRQRDRCQFKHARSNFRFVRVLALGYTFK
jgi:hypothetical protein